MCTRGMDSTEESLVVERCVAGLPSASQADAVQGRFTDRTGNTFMMAMLAIKNRLFWPQVHNVDLRLNPGLAGVGSLLSSKTRPFYKLCTAKNIRRPQIAE